MNMLSVEPFCKFTICSCAWKKLCLMTNKIVFDNKKIILSKNCVWRQTKLYLTTRKLYCQKIVFDDKQNCIWQQENCIVKKIVFDDNQNCIWQQANCVWRQKKNGIWKQANYIVKKLCLTTKKEMVFENKQIALSKNCVWRQAKLYLTTNKLCCCLESPIPKGVWNLKQPKWTLGGGCQSVHGLHILS